MIELRSDTFTMPSRAMRAAIAEAELGDNFYGEDPTVNELERLAAELLGKPAACLLPSGTMANLSSIMAHCPRGTKIIAGSESDIYLYEAAGAAVCAGVGYEPVRNLADGTLDEAGLLAAFPPDRDDPQFALPSLICLENSQNRCGGVILPMAYLAKVRAFAGERGVPVHLDGARVFNAAVGLGVDVREIAAYADSVQFCLSKGLSAPIGSVVAGGTEFVARVRRIRQMLGGTMRQAGIVAAAGIVALRHMVARLADDHANAQRLAEGLTSIPGVTVDPWPQTNIVLFRVDARFNVESFVAAAAAAGVALGGFGHGRIRAVTHSGIDAAGIDSAIDALERVLK
jgi:threonine aldolase